jgi:hypothetical protein
MSRRSCRPGRGCSPPGRDRSLALLRIFRLHDRLAPLHDTVLDDGLGRFERGEYELKAARCLDSLEAHRSNRLPTFSNRVFTCDRNSQKSRSRPLPAKAMP